MKESKIFSNAVAVSEEASLLTREQLTRLADADFADAVRMLLSFGYGGGVFGDDSFDIDALIGGELKALDAFIEDNCPDKRLEKILLNRYRYADAKVLYKSKLTGKPFEAALYGMDANANAQIAAGVYSELSPFMAGALRKLDETVPDSKTVDQTITQALYDDNAELARQSRNKILKSYVNAEVDLINIMTALRTAALGRDFAFCRAMLLSGGTLNVDTLFRIYNGGPSEIADTQYARLLNDGKVTDMLRLEAEGDLYLCAAAAAQRLEMNSVSPFFSYCLRKLTELKSVKMILTCIKNGVREEIPKRLRCVYD